MDTIHVMPTDTTIVSKPADPATPPPASAGTDPATPPPIPPAAPKAPAAPPPPAPPRRPWWREALHGCMIASFAFVVVAILALFAAMRGCVAIAKSAGKSGDAVKGAMAEFGGPYAKSDVEDLNLQRPGAELPKEAPKVLVVKLRGVIAFGDDDAPWKADAAGADAALRAIRKATLDPEVDGILLDVDSGGGEVTASDVLWKALKDFRASRQDSKTRRFVVTIMGATAASGAYYAAAASDWIVAHPSTITGSIGVKIESFNVRQFLEQRGVRRVSVTSGANKNMLSPFQDLTEPQRQLVQAEVDALHARFVDVVAKGRKLADDRVKALADGRVFLAEEAKKEGLVDEVGYLEDAKAKISSLLGGKAARYFVYGADQGFLKTLFSPSFLGAVVHEALPDAGLSEGSGVRAE